MLLEYEKQVEKEFKEKSVMAERTFAQEMEARIGRNYAADVRVEDCVLARRVSGFSG
jgi:hypothetical protein